MKLYLLFSECYTYSVLHGALCHPDQSEIYSKANLFSTILDKEEEMSMGYVS